MALRFSQNGQMNLNWIREGLKKPGKTQKGLADALGLDPAAVNRLLGGTRQLKASEIETVRNYLGANHPPESEIDRLTHHRSGQKDSSQDMLKVLGMAEGGPDGWNLWNGDVIETIRRPDNLIGVAGAYAVYITGHSMEPRYNAGELAHIHPNKPVAPGAYVLVQRKPLHDGDPPLAVIKRLVRRSGSKITLEQHNPAKAFDLKLEEVVSIHRVVGSSEA